MQPTGFAFGDDADDDGDGDSSGVNGVDGISLFIALENEICVDCSTVASRKIIALVKIHIFLPCALRTSFFVTLSGPRVVGLLFFANTQTNKRVRLSFRLRAVRIFYNSMCFFYCLVFFLLLSPFTGSKSLFLYCFIDRLVDSSHSQVTLSDRSFTASEMAVHFSVSTRRINDTFNNEKKSPIAVNSNPFDKQQPNTSKNAW